MEYLLCFVIGAGLFRLGVFVGRKAERKRCADLLWEHRLNELMREIPATKERIV